MVDVIEVMSAPVYVVSPKDTLSHARMTMLSRDVSRLVVVEDDSEPVGMLTKRDFVEGNAQKEPPERRRPLDSQRVSRHMSDNLITLTPSTDVEEAAEKMLENRVSGLPVVEGPEERYEEEGALISIVTKHDLTEHFSGQDTGIEVSDIYSPEIIKVHRHSSINRVVEEMQENEINRVIVKEDNGSPVGIITRSDLAFSELGEAGSGLREKELKLTRKAEKGGEKNLRSVERVSLVAEDIMTDDVVTMNLNQPAEEAAALMTKRGISGLPVLLDGDVGGIVTKTDVVWAVAEVER